MTGYPLSVSFYDKVGSLNTAKFILHKASATAESEYILKLTDILGSDGKSLMKIQDPATGNWSKPADANTNLMTINLNGVDVSGFDVTTSGDITFPDATAWPHVKFSGATGEFEWVGANAGESEKTDSQEAQKSIQLGITRGLATESPYLQSTGSGKAADAQDGVSNVKPSRGTDDGKGTGNAAGSLSGFTVQTDGKIFGVYTNGDKNLLGQIAVATFANPSGLEAAGNSLFSATKNSGDFDGVGIDISEVGKFSVGALEMSDVDLASEFTNMITTQRGFQANSRVITTSDSMLEELVNLKR